MTLRNNSSRNRLLVTYWQWCSWFSHVQLQCKYSPRSWSPWGAHRSPRLGKWIQCICQSRSLQLWGRKKKLNNQLHVTTPVTCTVNRNASFASSDGYSFFPAEKCLSVSSCLMRQNSREEIGWNVPPQGPHEAQQPLFLSLREPKVVMEGMPESITPSCLKPTVVKTGGSKQPLDTVCFVMLILLMLT